MVCSKFWKLDKIDKIIISLIFILVSIFSIFNCFCFASEDVDVVTLNGIRLDTSGGVTTFNSSSNGVGFYFEPIKGHTYIIKNNYTGTPSESAVSIINLPDIPYVGYQTSEKRIYLNPGVTYEYTSDDESIVCIFIGKNNYVDDLAEKITVVDITPVGFQAVIGNLTLNVGLSQLWNVFETSIPYALIVVVIAIGIYLIFRIIKGLSRGKGRL